MRLVTIWIQQVLQVDRWEVNKLRLQLRHNFDAIDQDLEMKTQSCCFNTLGRVHIVWTDFDIFTQWLLCEVRNHQKPGHNEE